MLKQSVCAVEAAGKTKSMLDVRRMLLVNVKLLGLEDHLGAYDLEPSHLKFDVFKRFEWRVLYSIVYFLLHHVSPSKTKRLFRIAWPICEKEQQSLFREIATGFLKELEKEHKVPSSFGFRSIFKSSGKT